MGELLQPDRRGRCRRPSPRESSRLHLGQVPVEIETQENARLLWGETLRKSCPRIHLDPGPGKPPAWTIPLGPSELLRTEPRQLPGARGARGSRVRPAPPDRGRGEILPADPPRHGQAPAARPPQEIRHLAGIQSTGQVPVQGASLAHCLVAIHRYQSYVDFNEPFSGHFAIIVTCCDTKFEHHTGGNPAGRVTARRNSLKGPALLMIMTAYHYPFSNIR